MKRTGVFMIRLRVDAILKEQGRSKYWLCKNLGMCYRNFSNLINNETTSIRYDTMERLCKILGVTVQELFEEIPDSSPKENDKQ